MSHFKQWREDQGPEVSMLEWTPAHDKIVEEFAFAVAESVVKKAMAQRDLAFLNGLKYASEHPEEEEAQH